MGMSQAFHIVVCVLIDLKTSLPLCNPYLDIEFSISPETLAEPLSVSTSVGKSILARRAVS